MVEDVALSSSTNAHLHEPVSLITGLLIAGLVIDLGGGPNHDRIGFRVSFVPSSFASMTFFISTGNIPAHSIG